MLNNQRDNPGNNTIMQYIKMWHSTTQETDKNYDNFKRYMLKFKTRKKRENKDI